MSPPRCTRTTRPWALAPLAEIFALCHPGAPGRAGPVERIPPRMLCGDEPGDQYWGGTSSIMEVSPVWRDRKDSCTGNILYNRFSRFSFSDLKLLKLLLRFEKLESYHVDTAFKFL